MSKKRREDSLESPISESNSADELLNIDPTHQPGYLLWHVSLLWQRTLENVVADLELTHSQFMVLSAIQSMLTHQQAPVTQTLLSQSWRIDTMVVSQVSRRLAEKGLIERVPHPQDSRARVLRLTPAGEEVVVDARRAVMAAAKQFFNRSGDGQELARLLRQISDSFD